MNVLTEDLKLINNDLSKPFDIIDHDLLLNKSSKFGMSQPIIKVLHSYLVVRKHVEGNGFISN